MYVPTHEWRRRPGGRTSCTTNPRTKSRDASCRSSRAARGIRSVAVHPLMNGSTDPVMNGKDYQEGELAVRPIRAVRVGMRRARALVRSGDEASDLGQVVHAWSRCSASAVQTAAGLRDHAARRPRGRREPRGAVVARTGQHPALAPTSPTPAGGAAASPIRDSEGCTGAPTRPPAWHHALTPAKPPGSPRPRRPFC